MGTQSLWRLSTTPLGVSSREGQLRTTRNTWCDSDDVRYFVWIQMIIPFRCLQMYCMEFKTMVLEQLSEIKERCFLEKYNYNPPVLQNGYGVILQCTIVRDLVAMTTEFMSNEAKTILKVSLDIAQNNYPEMLYKSHLVSTSWMFSTLVTLDEAAIILIQSHVRFLLNH